MQLKHSRPGQSALLLRFTYIFISFRTSVFLDLHEGAELQGLRDRSGGEEISRTKEQLDVMNMAAPHWPKGPAAACHTPTDTPQGRG